MSTEQPNNQVTSLLAKLNKTLKKKPATTEGQGGNNSNFVDYKKLNEEKKLLKAKAFAKCKTGINNYLFLTLAGSEDPFSEWGTHPGLQSVPYYTIDCDAHNKGENCLVCNVVKDLGTPKEEWEKHKNIIKPINKKVDVYALVIDLENEVTIAEGPKWLKVAKNVLEQMVVWLTNLDKDEKPFYDKTAPLKIIITFNPGTKTEKVDPKDMYTVDKKNMKCYSDEQYDIWQSAAKPLSHWLGDFKRTPEQVKALIDSYLERVLKQVESESENESTEEAQDETEENTEDVKPVEEIKQSEKKASGKLSDLKTDKK